MISNLFYDVSIVNLYTEAALKVIGVLIDIVFELDEYVHAEFENVLPVIAIVHDPEMVGTKTNAVVGVPPEFRVSAVAVVES